MIRIVHRDAQDVPVYWCGYTNGYDGQGWTAEQGEALTFATLSDGNLERNRARKWLPTMKMTLEDS